MVYILFIILAVLSVVLLFAVFSSVKRLNKLSDDIKKTSLLGSEIVSMRKEVSDRLSDVAKTTGSSNQIMSDVKEGLGAVKQITQNVMDLSKSITDLEQILSPPKLRGGLGELMLEEIIRQVLPRDSYEMQYKFSSGNTVDAVIKAGNKLVCVDSKFPLENFKKGLQSANETEKSANLKKFISDIKKHIDDIASKYILPDEKTYDFALMYIPAENVYYEIMAKNEVISQEQEVFSYAVKKKVIPVSPSSFYAYLQVILLGLKGMTLEKNAHDILSGISRLEGDLKRFREDFEIMGRHIKDAQGRYLDSEKQFIKIEEKVLSFQKMEDPAITEDIKKG